MNDRVKTAEAFRMEVSDVCTDVRNHSPYMSPVIIADMQRQVRENVALEQSLREEFRPSS